MPYYERFMSVLMNEPDVKSGRKLRTMPPFESASTPPPALQPPHDTILDKGSISMLRLRLKKNLEELKTAQSTTSTAGDTDFINYTINYVIEKDRSKTKFVFFNQQLRELVWGRVFGPDDLTGAKNHLYFKLLQKIGRSCPFIVGTSDIYLTRSCRVYVFQEFANRGSAYDFLKENPTHVGEFQVSQWGDSIRNAMDYLGTLGIAHGNIHPKHILLNCAADDGCRNLIAKLSGLQDAVIYYDVSTNGIIAHPCKPVAKRPWYAFQAPEVFSENFGSEFYDPVAADVWSFGATLLFLAGRTFAFNFQSPELNLDEVIRKNVHDAPLSNDGKSCLYGMLRANTAERTTFQALLQDLWF